MDDLVPAGRFFCRSCFCEQDFILAEGASPEEKEPPIECYVCGYVYDRNIVEVDPSTGERLAPNLTVRSALPFDLREKARSKMREDFMAATLRDGVRAENYNGVVRRSRGSRGVVKRG